MTQSPLLFLVGGPKRTGKSIIGRRFNARTGVSVVSSDDVIGMLEVAAPALGIGHDTATTWRVNRDLCAPFLEAFAEIRCRRGLPVLIEGELLPESVGRLLEWHGCLVRACFVGDIAASAESKYETLVEHIKREPLDWLWGYSEAQISRIAKEILEDSREYEQAAGELEIPFFDMQPDFEAAVDRVVNYLVDS